MGSAIVTGLCRDVPEPPGVVLSPRGAVAVAKLAEAFGTVRVADGNQGVVDAADVVLVCLRQADLPALGELTWRADQVVISASAGLSLDRLAEVAAPARRVARAVPMPAVARRASVTPVQPPLPEAVALFDRLGGTLPLDTAEQFDAIFVGLGTVAPFFEFLNTIAGFLEAHGVPAASARRLLADSFVGIVQPLADLPDPDFKALVREYATPGGGNEQLAMLMRADGVSEATRRGLDEVYRRFTSV